MVEFLSAFGMVHPPIRIMPAYRVFPRRAKPAPGWSIPPILDHRALFFLPHNGLRPKSGPMKNPPRSYLLAGDAPVMPALAKVLTGFSEAVLLARPEGDPAGDAALAAALGLPVWGRGYGAWDSAAGAVAEARTAFGGLDALVHAPRQKPDTGGILAAEPWAAEAALRDPLFQAYYLAAAAAPVLRRDGCLLFIGHASGIFGAEDGAARAAANAGLLGLVRALARELAPRGLRANLLLPLDGCAPEDAAIVAAWLCAAESDGPSGQVFLCHDRAVWLLGQGGVQIGGETRRIARLERPWDIATLRQATREAFSPYYFQAGVEANHLAQR